ncbi:hypothetical protein ACFOOM_07725 [Streptomyces echinoruber]|uniref:Uncharacterized protein n=1 Tax=Streptomyces echinoruber TaxID=68898 RepID=A0A918QZT8_9ACTN|nr:hypothetical protein [Streptomyces echinoruber]GGZ80435.1 hypothetical protein GCM10010389_17840 [Streptomyces echinoruber]
MTTHKDTDRLIRALKNQGFRVEQLRSGRCRVVPPGGGDPVMMPGPGRRTDARALDNARARLRRLGADV